MRNKSNIFVGIVSAIFAFVATMVLFADMFTATYGGQKYGKEYGTGYQVMFGLEQGKSLNGVPLLVMAFVFLCVAFALLIVAAIMAGKVQGLVFAVSALLLIAAGVLFLFSVSLFDSANKSIIDASGTYHVDELSLGAAPISCAVFALLGGVLSLYGAYSAFKA